jgi:hypothetical protein
MRYRRGHARVAARRGPTRLQVTLAATWMILSLLIGGALSAQAQGEGASLPSSVTPITH